MRAPWGHLFYLIVRQAVCVCVCMYVCVCVMCVWDVVCGGVRLYYVCSSLLPFGIAIIVTHCALFQENATL